MGWDVVRKGTRILSESPGEFYPKKLGILTGGFVVRTVYVPRASPGGSDGKESACSTGDLGSIPGSGISPGEGNGFPFQYSCLENPMDRGAWQAIQSMGLQRVRHD